MMVSLSKKIRYVLLGSLLLLCAQAVFTQESVIDINSIDFGAVNFSQSRLSQAGPNAFLMRPVQIQDEPYSIIFREVDGTWIASEFIAETGPTVLPNNVILEFTTISITNTGLMIDGIIIDGQAYSTVLNLSSNGRFIPQSLTAATLTGNSLNRVIDDIGPFIPSGSGTGSTERDTRLVAEIGNLDTYLDTLETEGERLLEQISRLRSEKDSLSQEIDAIQGRIAQVDARDPGEAPAVGASGVEEENRGLRVRIDNLLEKVVTLETQIEALQQNTERPSTLSGQVKEIEDEIARLRLENARLSAERNDIEQEIRRQLLQEGYIASLSPELTDLRQQGFDSSKTQIGSWQRSGNQISQTNADEFFAKLELPLPQEEAPTLYSFEGRSRNSGWVGFGIHVFADNVRKRGYGYGESLLLWFTRDPKTYGTNRTYLEIYQSSDDVNMARVVNAAITEPIDEWMDIDLLYQPGDEYITVAVNGEEKLRYKTWFGITEGVTIALRTLNRADFRNLEIYTSP